MDPCDQNDSWNSVDEIYNGYHVTSDDATSRESTDCDGYQCSCSAKDTRKRFQCDVHSNEDNDCSVEVGVSATVEVDHVNRFFTRSEWCYGENGTVRDGYQFRMMAAGSGKVVCSGTIPSKQDLQMSCRKTCTNIGPWDICLGQRMRRKPTVSTCERPQLHTGCEHADVVDLTENRARLRVKDLVSECTSVANIVRDLSSSLERSLTL